MRLLEQLRAWARHLKAQLLTVWLLARHPRTPRLAKWVAALTLAYALSPIDLIPDFIPILGLLDDLLLVPTGLWLALRLTPADVINECREAALEDIRAQRRLPINRMAGLVIAAIWALVAGLLLAVALG